MMWIIIKYPLRKWTWVSGYFALKLKERTNSTRQRILMNDGEETPLE